MRSDIFPLKRDEVDNTKNLDLNTTARKNEKTVEKSSPYLLNSTYAVLIANLARPIGEFDEKQELINLKKASTPPEEAEESPEEKRPEAGSGLATSDKPED